MVVRKKDENTSPEVATKASKLLRDKKSSPIVKSVAGSALSNTKDKPKTPTKSSSGKKSR